MAVRSAEAQWEGDLTGGKGTMSVESGAFEGQYSFSSRFEQGVGTNPEELLGAAHAGCFSMAFSHALAQAGHVPTKVHTRAKVHLGPVEGGFAITAIELDTEAVVPGIGEADFLRIAAEAKVGCPVSKALAATPISLRAKLAS
jgi:osmotically inducible protein OsmC